MSKQSDVESINHRIEELRAQKQSVDESLVSLSNQMKMLNLEASTRAKLNLKRGDAKVKEEAYTSG